MEELEKQKDPKQIRMCHAMAYSNPDRMKHLQGY